jgi:SAM-dependent methyltransferase
VKQNKYDEPGFFAKFSQFPQSSLGLDEYPEWPAFRSALPPLAGTRVLDLGCGFGWHCRHAREQGAASVVGIDLSQRMLAKARELNPDPAIEFRQGAIEEMDLPAESFDVVLSSVVLQYVEKFDEACRKIFAVLRPGGHFVFSVQHPVFTANAHRQDFVRDKSGRAVHWPLDNYHYQGMRVTNFVEPDVVMYHRTIETTVNTTLDAGFALLGLYEPYPSPELMAARSYLTDERRRPRFLLLSLRKPA